MQASKAEQNADFLEKKKISFHLYRRLFLLVFSVVMLWQGVLLADNGVRRYYTELNNSFKMLLSLREYTTDEELQNLSARLQQREGVAEVKAYNAQEALDALHRQNPQLVDTMLLLGNHKMPAYFEVKLDEKAVANIKSFADNLALHFVQLNVRYNAEHARLIVNAGLFCKLLRLVEMVSLLALAVFMFLVEASARRAVSGVSGFFSGILAAASAVIVLAAVVYPVGYLPQVWNFFISAKQQVILLVMGGLLGWTFSKWQRF